MSKVLAAQRESEATSARASMARAELERTTAELAEAQAEFDAARRDWAAVVAQLRQRYPAKADERHLVAALKEGMLAPLGDQDAPDAATLLRRRTARLRKVIGRYMRAAV